ncbi:MAG TPA: cytochrome c [Gemmatales bacterium]|nr:cytochrome c [Gemmatales bacterium]
MNWSKSLLVLAASMFVLSGAFAAVLHDGIEEIMEKGFKKGGLRHQISTEVDKDKPNWPDVEKKSVELKKLCDALCKEKQPQGEAASWKKLTEELTKNTKSLGDAAGRKDHANAKAFVAKINNSCKECHDIHRP